MSHLARKSALLLTAVAVLSVVLLGLSPVADLSALAGTPGWRQSNSSGFGFPQNHTIGALTDFGNQMYAGTWNESGAQVWRSADGQSWSPVTPAWSTANMDVEDAKAFGPYLYVGTGRDAGGEIWRTTSGTTWERVASGGLGDGNNYGFNAFAVFSNALYVATANYPPVLGGTGKGVEIWRSTTGNAGSWTQVNSDGFGSPTMPDVVVETYNGHLYVGLSRTVGAAGSIAELWRSPNGTTWTPVFTDGLGSPDNTAVSAMAEFKGDLYIGLRNTVTGGQVWRSSDGTQWAPVVTGGLGVVANSRPYGLIVFDDQLYLVFSNVSTGAEVWQSDDGVAWRPISTGGWGDGNNGFADYFDKAAVVFKNSLYIGTANDVDGGEIWQRLRQLYLPLSLRGS